VRGQTDGPQASSAALNEAALPHASGTRRRARWAGRRRAHGGADAPLPRPAGCSAGRGLGAAAVAARPAAVLSPSRALGVVELDIDTGGIASSFSLYLTRDM